MAVRLLPPVTGIRDRSDAHALEEAPPLVRTRAMSRWHRPRSGYREGVGRVVLNLWCGPYVSGDYLTRTIPVTGERICGTCEGRAAGAGQIPQPEGRELVFNPRELHRPRYCPGSRTVLYQEQPGGRVGRCLVCSTYEPVRAMGGPYDPRFAITQHPPGPGLVSPCPWHRWKQLVAHDAHAVCACTRGAAS
ncbi:hypothetical protein [Streptomyces pseudovenezuelae]|uniref:hypothetical protein n=1 Tax=Streptomyces pseudovenezuelae TaxID=67350 RepID=UPI0036E9B1C2